MLWPVPLPNMADLGSAMLVWLKSSKKETLRKVPGYQSSLWFRGGAQALSFICRHIECEHKKSVKLLLPSYFCGQTLRFLRGEGVEFGFYQLNRDFSPNFASAELLIDPQKSNLFLHVHYFGHFFDTQDSVDFCQRNNCLLIEDCAHIISPFVGMPFVGEFVIFAPHKMIAVKCGGLLLAKGELPDAPNRQKSLFPLVWYLKRLSQRYLTRTIFWQRHGKWEIVWSDEKQAEQYSLPSLIEVEALIRRLNHPEVLIETRRLNSLKIAALIGCEGNPQLIKKFHQDDVPYLVGLRFTKISDLHKFVNVLDLSGCPYMMWPDLPVEIALAEGDFKADLDRTLLTVFLFIHEEINIEKYTTCIKKALDAVR